MKIYFPELSLENADAHEYRYCDENAGYCVDFALEKDVAFDGWGFDNDVWIIRALAWSTSILEDADCFYYDAFSSSFHHGATSEKRVIGDDAARERLENAIYAAEPGDENPGYFEIADWVPEHMGYLREQESEAESLAWEFAREHEGEDFGDWKALKNAIWDKWAAETPNGGQYDIMACDAAYIGEEFGYFRKSAQGYTCAV